MHDRLPLSCNFATISSPLWIFVDDLRPTFAVTADLPSESCCDYLFGVIHKNFTFQFISLHSKIATVFRTDFYVVPPMNQISSLA